MVSVMTREDDDEGFVIRMMRVMMVMRKMMRWLG